MRAALLRGGRTTKIAVRVGAAIAIFNPLPSFPHIRPFIDNQADKTSVKLSLVAGKSASDLISSYTEALLSAVPIADTSVKKKRVVLDGDIPSALNPPSGCPFQTRCRFKDQVAGGLCEREVPPVQEVAGGHSVKCHLPKDVLAKMEPVIVMNDEL